MVSDKRTNVIGKGLPERHPKRELHCSTIDGANIEKDIKFLIRMKKKYKKLFDELTKQLMQVERKDL